MANILLTGGRAPATLELARIFHRADHAVYMAESAPHHLSEPSRAVRESFRVPPPRQESGAFIQALTDIIEKNGIDLLVPTCEEVFYVAMARDRLPCRVFSDSIDKLSMLHNKWFFAANASDMGLSVPESYLVGTSDELMMAFAQWRELVLKPVYSRFATRTLVEPSLNQALRALAFDPGSQWIVQERIGGSQICTYSVAQRGRLTAHSAYRSEFTAGQGATILFQPIHHQASFDWVQRFIASIGFTGQVSFDFIETPDGDVYALECNPRLTSGVHLFADQPEFAQAFLDGSLPLLSPAGGRSSMLMTAMLAYGLPASMRQKRFRAWLAAFLSSRDVIFDIRDPLPFLLQWRSILYYLRVGREHGLSALAASTFDIEWNGEECSLEDEDE